MIIHSLEFKQTFSKSREQVWEFISDPNNLALITPEYMGFEVLPGVTGSMYSGQIIQYRVSPISGIRMNWVTEITHVRQGEYFVDEQRFGPYSFWHHQHHLHDTEDGGTLMVDILHYKLPAGIAGRAVNHLFVRGQLNKIFKYRYEQLEKIFA